jgi:hypothetical protein
MMNSFSAMGEAMILAAEGERMIAQAIVEAVSGFFGRLVFGRRNSASAASRG